jgi:cobalt-zinc-cadmium efflux system outer membrane protein
MRALEAALTASKGGIITARTYANPELTFAPGVRRSLQDNSFVTDFKGVLSLSQLLKFPGKRALEIAIAEHDAKLRQLAIEAFRFQIAAKVSRAFYDMLAAQKIVEVRNEQLGSAKIFVESAQKRAESGFAGDFETVKGQADLVTARVALREAEKRVMTARITLNTLLGRQPPTPLAITGSLENLAPRGGVTDFNALAMGRNPALQAQVIEAQKSGLNLRLTRFGNRPDFAIGPTIEYSRDEQIFAISATVALPLWDQKKGEIQTASAEQRKALAELEKLRLEIRGEVTKAAAGLDVAKDQLAFYSPVFLEKLRAFVRQAEEGYAQNSTTLLFYLDAKRTYFDTLAAYHEALSRVAEARAELESAVGVPLELKP